jgi:hypothetical protein
MQPIQALEQGMSALTLSSQTNQGSSKLCNDIAPVIGFPVPLVHMVFEYSGLIRQPLQQRRGANTFTAILYPEEDDTRESPRFNVVSFSIGMHRCQRTEREYKAYLEQYLEAFPDAVQLNLLKLELTVEKIVEIVQRLGRRLSKERLIDLNISAWFEKNEDRETELDKQLSQIPGNPGELFFHQNQTYIRCCSSNGDQKS